MRRVKPSPLVLVTTLGIVLGVMAASDTGAQRREPEVVAVIDGDTVYQVLPPGAIPAITDPIFVTGKEAARQMADDEPVIGLVINGEARAYSMWHLDGHEIVNDVIGKTAVAVTW